MKTFSREVELGAHIYKVEIYVYPGHPNLKSGFSIARRKRGKPDGEWITSHPTYYWWHPDELPKLIEALQEVHTEWVQWCMTQDYVETEAQP